MAAVMVSDAGEFPFDKGTHKSRLKKVLDLFVKTVNRENVHTCLLQIICLFFTGDNK
jgi:hypothetical protein